MAKLKNLSDDTMVVISVADLREFVSQREYEAKKEVASRLKGYIRDQKALGRYLLGLDHDHGTTIHKSSPRKATGLNCKVIDVSNIKQYIAD